MKIAVIGSGAIGNLIAGYLKLNGQDVSLVGHADSVKAITEHGLNISGVRGNFNLKLDISSQLQTKADLAILTVKTQDIPIALKTNLKFLSGINILTTQNGIQADNLAAKYIPQEKIISSIVMFGATYLEPAKVVHNFEGSWILGMMFTTNDAQVDEIAVTLKEIFPTLVTEDIRGMKYLKVFINANNCLAAILGVSMQEAFSNLEVSSLAMAIWKEGLGVINRAGINLASLPDFPLERLTKLTALPLNESAKVFSGIMNNLSKEPLYGSVLQSIKRGRPSEIDYLNGEFVNLAKVNNLSAPLNEKLVEMVHSVEKNARFFSKKELLNNLKEFLN